MTLRNEMVLKQPCTTKMINTNNFTKIEISTEKFEWWDKPILSLSYLPIAPFPNVLESPISFYGKDRQIDKIKLIETFQGSQMNNIIKKVIPIILSDSLDPCLAPFEVDDFDVNGYIIKSNDLVDTSYPKTTPLWIKKYEPSPNLPIAFLLESPSILELKSLPDAPIDTLLVIPNQEVQLVGILKVHKKLLDGISLK